MSPTTTSLPYIAPSKVEVLEPPKLRIKIDADVLAWKTTSGYATLLAFVRALSDAVVGHELPLPDDPNGNTSLNTPVSLFF
jgi:hypothetical protein